MSFKRFSQILPVVLALALWAGTANAQTLVLSTPTAFSYTQGSVGNTAAQTLTIADLGGSTTVAYTLSGTTMVSGGAWLTVGSTTNGSLTPDAIQISVDATVAKTLGTGSFSTILSFAGTSVDTSAVQVTVTLNVLSPLSAGTASSTTLTFVTGGGASQAAASSTIVVSNTDSADDTYTVKTAAACPVFLVSTSTGGYQAKSGVGAGNQDTLTMSIKTAGTAAAASITTCNIQLQYNLVTFATVTFVNVAVVAQPLLLTTPTAALSWNKSAQSGQQTTSVTVKSPPSTSPIPLFSLDLATLPPWLTASINTGSASILGQAVTFTLVTGVAGGMPTGNYSQMVGFYSGTYGDVYATISLQVSNAVPSLTTLPTGTTSTPLGSSSPQPTPSVTVYSSDEPAPFIATCTVTLSPATYVATVSDTQGCSLNGAAALTQVNGLENVVNGTAFTWGYTLTANLDPKYFAQAIGNVVTVTITFTGTNATAPSPVIYAYTLQPGTPTINVIGGATSGLVPASVTAKYPTAQSLLVLVQGTNFVTPGSIVGGVILPTQLWLGATKLDNSTNTATGSYVVLSATQMMVTIPGTSPVFVAVASGHTGSIVIGIANQTSAVPAASTTSASLTLTYAPVIYAVTDTATYVQPSPVGTLPSFSPYELISIFGDNFVLPNGLPAISVFDGNGKIVAPIQIVAASGTGTSAIKAETLAVNFVNGTHTYSAPVLYVNENQINAIVPSQVLTGTNYTVTVGLAGGTVLTSDNSVTAAVQNNNPGIFTLASDGTGAGAIINQDGTVNGSGHTAAAASIITLYASGLGTPTSSGLDALGNVAAFPSTCVSPAAWFTNVTTKITGASAYTPPSPAWTSIDGAVIEFGPHAIIAGNFQPCMATDTITVTLSTTAGGSVTPITGAGITYAGWVSGSVAGLYQINATLPGTLTGLTGKINVTLTVNGVTSPVVTMLVP